MNPKTTLFLTLIAASLVPAARAQLDVGVDIRLGHATPPPPPEVVVIEQAGPSGPPPWARSHWYHRSYGYYYYPGYDVYYRPSDRVWFYREGPTWRSAGRLPDNIRVDFGRAVSLTLESDRPYTYHDRVVAYYPPNYFSRVRFKNDRDNRRDDRRDDHDDRDDRGRDRDKDRRH